MRISDWSSDVCSSDLDCHAKKRWLSVPEIFMYSSNIGAAKMAMDVGTEGQRACLDRIGLLDPSPIELPEVGTPLVPDVWRPINTMTIAFGHGIAVSPLQVASGTAAMVNGGIQIGRASCRERVCQYV